MLLKLTKKLQVLMQMLVLWFMNQVFYTNEGLYNVKQIV